MRMTIPTSDDGDGSLSPVAWSHDECMVRLGLARGPVSLFSPLSCANSGPCELVWKERCQLPSPSWKEGQWAKRVTAVRLHSYKCSMHDDKHGQKSRIQNIPV